jgi:hypothetical protein
MSADYTALDPDKPVSEIRNRPPDNKFGDDEPEGKLKERSPDANSEKARTTPTPPTIALRSPTASKDQPSSLSSASSSSRSR